jgi:hypothetical protein
MNVLNSTSAFAGREERIRVFGIIYPAESTERKLFV